MSEQPTFAGLKAKLKHETYSHNSTDGYSDGEDIRHSPTCKRCYAERLEKAHKEFLDELSAGILSGIRVESYSKHGLKGQIILRLTRLLGTSEAGKGERG